MQDLRGFGGGDFAVVDAYFLRLMRVKIPKPVAMALINPIVPRGVSGITSSGWGIFSGGLSCIRSPSVVWATMLCGTKLLRRTCSVRAMPIIASRMSSLLLLCISGHSKEFNSPNISVYGFIL